ncbi:methyl-accepting chemotaxis protein [Desulfocurvus vexinensis]|uniref:methyl-accepting chemotaxis protein n=1 Tax=Desulfocurvus vexinensis TaxID=399548 RepID=UPI00048BA9AD|nr:methyl-accepting chemotaxis protein [Desulfocurvus vexinensis]
MLKKNLGTVLIASVALAVILAVAGIVAYVSGSTYHLALEQKKQAMTQMTTTSLAALELYMENVQTMATTLSARRTVRDALEGDPSRVDDDLRLFLTEAGNLWGVVVFDHTGMVVAGRSASGEDLAGKSRADRDYVRAILSGQDLYVPRELLQVESAGVKTLAFPVAKAVRSAQGQVLGGVCLLPLWEEFTRAFIDPPRFGERGYGFMLDAKGRIIAHAMDKSLLLKDLSEHDFIREALRTHDGDFFYEWGGEAKYLVVATDPATGWVVCMSAYVAELTATATRQRNVLLGIGAGAVLVLVLTIALIVSRLLVRPLRRIEAFTASIAAGDFRADLGTGFRFEMKSLAENIRTMVGELKQKLGFAQGVLDGFVLPCSVFDRDNRATFINAHMMRALDKDGDPKAHLGQTSGRLVYGDDTRETVSLRALRENRRLDVETTYTTARGVEKIFDVTSTPIADLDGNLIGVLAVWFELTEIRAQQKRIEAQNEKIARAAAAATAVSDQVASASEELSAQIEQSSRGSEEQRNRTGEAATAMEEMNATVIEVARSASTAAELADRANAKAREGEALVDEVVQTITQVNTRAEELKADMTELGRQAEGIGQIMNVIADIADQTNLLALNAAIEAARAGDAGRGFAVVADEVRKLAEKTMSATNEVGAYIRAVQESARKNIRGTEATTEAITASTGTAGRSGAALREIVAMVEQTADQVRGIATASEEQSAASDEISRTTEEINNIARETAEAMNQSAQAVSDLARLAQELKSIISEMQN